VDKRNHLLLALGFALTCASLTAIGTLKQDRSQARVSPGREGVADEPLVDPRQRSSEGEDEAPRTDTSRERFGPYRVESAAEAEDHRATVYDPRGEEVLAVGNYAGATLRSRFLLFGRPLLEVVEKGCYDPCNPVVHLVALRGETGVEVLAAQGTVRLEDLDSDGVPEVLVEHLMAETPERVVLPLRFDGQRFVNGYDLHAQLVDRQSRTLTGAMKARCGTRAPEECLGLLRAFVGLALFRSDPDLARTFEEAEIAPSDARQVLDAEMVRALEAEMKEAVGAAP
jgi:hypothetical protein